MRILEASKPRRRTAVLAGLLAALCLAGAPLAADVIIQGDPAFIMKVEAALQKIRDTGGKPAEILNDLESSSNDHVISQGGNGTGYNDVNDANSMAAGGTGKGTGTSVGWNPDESGTTKGGVPYDPCITLAHELSHAQDGDNGTRDPRADPSGSGIPTNEVEACADENRFRKSMHPPKPPRTDYGCVDLPADAVCPPDLVHADAVEDVLEEATGSMTPISWYRPDRTRRHGVAPLVVAPAPTASVVLGAVASSPQYLLGETVEIKVTLTNQSLQTLGLSDRVEGNLRVVSFLRDGVAVPARTTGIDFFEGLGLTLSKSLVAVAPGESLQTLWRSAGDPVLGGQALGTVQYSARDDDGLTLDGLLSPGTYSVTLVYQYPGPTNMFPGTVYTRQTNTATVSFTVL